MMCHSFLYRTFTDYQLTSFDWRTKRSISSIIVRSRAFRHRIGVEQIPENRECQMERKGIRLTGNLIWSRSPAKGSAPRLTPNVRVLPSPACIIGADV